MNKTLTLITLLCLFSSVSWSQTEINDEHKQMMKLVRSIHLPLNIKIIANMMQASNRSLTRLVCQVSKEASVKVPGMMTESVKAPDEIIVFAYNEEFLAINSPTAGPNAWIGLQMKTPKWGMIDIWDKRFNTDDSSELGISSIYNDVIIKFSMEREDNPEDIPWENGLKKVSESVSYTVNRVTNEIQYYKFNDLLMQNPNLKGAFSTTIGNGNCTISDAPF